MSNLINVSIKESPLFRGAYEVHATYRAATNVNGWARTHAEGATVNYTDIHKCANLRTAIALRDRIENPEPTPVVTSTPEPTPNLEQVCGCLTGGLGYTPAVTWLLTGRVEQVHNWATARTLADRYPADECLTSAVF